MNIDNNTVSLQGVIAASPIIYKHLKPTPLRFYQGLSDLLGARIYIKHENCHPGGSFKIRGGINIMHHLKKNNANGVITFSTGNHGVSIASSAAMFGIEATIVIPENSNPAKVAMIRETGARLIESGKTLKEAAEFGMDFCAKNSLKFIHAANEPMLIHGVGTEFLEILQELPEVDAIILPLGGGSEVAAAVTVLKTINPRIEIYAVQAAASPGAYNSWKNGFPQKSDNRTFAGGFATNEAFVDTFSIYKNALSDFVLLSEDEIYSGIHMALKHTHYLAEGAGAATIIAAYHLRERLKGKNVILQMSGANEDIENIKKAINISLPQELDTLHN